MKKIKPTKVWVSSKSMAKRVKKLLPNVEVEIISHIIDDTVWIIEGKRKTIKCNVCEGEGSVMMVADECDVGRKICSKCLGTGKVVE